MGSKLKESNPGISFGDLSKLQGEKWKNINPEEKSKYETFAKKDKER